MMEFVSWGYKTPTEWKVIKAMFETTKQIIYTSRIFHLPNLVTATPTCVRQRREGVMYELLHRDMM